MPRELDRRLRVEFDSFFRTLDRSRYVPVLSHLDLGPDHILWDHRVGRPTGVLDWEDARFADPAFDLTGLGFLGPRRLAPLVAARRDLRDEKFLARLAFYRGAVGVHQLLYAVEQGDSALVQRSTRALSRALAPAPAS